MAFCLLLRIFALMMTTNIDIYTITVGGLLLVLACLTPLCSAFFRRIRYSHATTPPDNQELPPISVVMTVHNNAPEIERNLPLFLSQHYAAGYEVIVVDESSTDQTDDILTALKADYPHLYTTFIPNSSHYLSRHKLALTLGIKAAHYEWIVLTEVTCHPEGDQWLAAVGSYATDNADLLIGYTKYDSQTPDFWKFYRLLNTCYQERCASHGTAYCYDGHNLALRRSVFMSHNGFLTNLKYLRGEYDYIVNEYALPGRTIVMASPQAWLTEDCPSKKAWTYERLHHIESRRHLKRSLSWNLLHIFDQTSLWFNLLFCISVLAVSVVFHHLILCAVAVTAWLLAFLLRTIIGRKTVLAYGETISSWTIPLLEVRTLFLQLFMRQRFFFSDHYDFIRR